jgi:hypothetical protein
VKSINKKTNDSIESDFKIPIEHLKHVLELADCTDEELCMIRDSLFDFASILLQQVSKDNVL